jgi:hypothetical protein
MESVRTVYGVPISTIPNGTADRRQVSLDLLFTVFAVSRVYRSWIELFQSGMAGWETDAAGLLRAA